MKIAQILPLIAASLCFDGVRAENCSSTPFQATPSLQWKYGWRDGHRSNLLGSARTNDTVPLASSTLVSGYSPAQVAHAYGFDQISSNGNGVTIAVVVAYGSPSIQQDLNAFCSQYNLPATAIQLVYPYGKPSKSDSGWAGEATLDVEWSHAMAPGASIILVVSPDAGLGNLLSCANYAATSLHANVVSMSWGAPEFAGASFYDGYFNVPGVSFVASSGDSGAGVLWPACSPYVLAVGGTSLQYNNSTGKVSSEVAWSGSGGGISRQEMLPAYQLGWNVNAGRGVPDVSYVADPYTGVSVYFTDPSTNVGGWYVFGGTSAGAPQWAALLARRAGLGNAGTLLVQTLLYGTSVTKTSASYTTLFRDITSGNNGAYPAVLGYDNVTGLGSPLANSISVLPKSLPTPTPAPATTPTPTPSPKPTATPSPSPTPRNSPTPVPRRHSMTGVSKSSDSFDQGGGGWYGYYELVSRYFFGH
jgi:subtilase family serine protease